MSNLSAGSSLGVAVTTPFNIIAGQQKVVANDTVATPVMVYGATSDAQGGILTVQAGGAVTGTISFFGAGGEVDDLTGAANTYNIFGGGGLLRLSGVGASATFANTQNDWGDVYGDSVSLTLQGAQVNVYGGDNLVTLSSGEGDAAALYGALGQWNTVQGDGGVTALAGGNASVVGSLNTIYAAAGSWLSLYATDAGADQVYARSTFVILNAASADLTGGGDAVFTHGASSLTLSGTQGVWDGVVGSGATIAIVDAQAAISGGDDTISATAGSWMSLYATHGQADSVTASNANIILTDAAALVTGGGDLIWMAGDSALNLSGTAGAWDMVQSSGDQIVLNQAEVSIFGGANIVAATNSFLSLYATGAAADTVTGADNCLALTNAAATLNGADDTVYMFGDSALTLLGDGDAIYADSYVGNQTLTGFDAQDVLHLSASLAPDFATLAASGALAQNGADTNLQLDASHVLTPEGRDGVHPDSVAVRLRLTLAAPPATAHTGGLTGGRYDASRKVFLRRRRDRSGRRARGDGLLPLRILPVVVGEPDQRLHPLEARVGEGDQRRRQYRDLRQDGDERAQVLQDLRRPHHGQPPHFRPRRHLRRDDSRPRLQADAASQLSGDRPARSRRPAEVQGFPEGVRRLRRQSARMIRGL